MAQQQLNLIQYQNNLGIYQQINVARSEVGSRALIRDFILTQFGVDVANNPYALWFEDINGYWYQLDPGNTIRQSFREARTRLNGQRVVLCVWHQNDSKPSNWTFPSVKCEVKEEKCLAFSHF